MNGWSRRYIPIWPKNWYMSVFLYHITYTQQWKSYQFRVHNIYKCSHIHFCISLLHVDLTYILEKGYKSITMYEKAFSTPSKICMVIRSGRNIHVVGQRGIWIINFFTYTGSRSPRILTYNVVLNIVVENFSTKQWMLYISS